MGVAMAGFHIAHLNIARARADLDSEIMRGFVARLDEINALAEHSPGFVWRLQGEEGDADILRVFGDPLLVANVTLWESVAALHHFTYKTVHAELLRNREAWFARPEQSSMVLWWVPEGELPTVEEAANRLQLLRDQGPTAQAFTFGKAYEPERGSRP